MWFEFFVHRCFVRAQSLIPSWLIWLLGTAESAVEFVVACNPETFAVWASRKKWPPAVTSDPSLADKQARGHGLGPTPCRFHRCATWLRRKHALCLVFLEGVCVLNSVLTYTKLNELLEDKEDKLRVHF